MQHQGAGQTQLRLAGVWLYPVKSCAGHEVPWAQVTPQAGLAGHPPVKLESFRANLLIDAPDESLLPFAEEAFSSISWHGDLADPPLLLTMSSRCVRCVMPNIDLATGEAGREPLALLATMSRERGLRAPSFGVYGASVAAGRLARGMHGHAVSRAEERSAPSA